MFGSTMVGRSMRLLLLEDPIPYELDILVDGNECTKCVE